MFALNISCTVCKETFKNSDTIYTTSCGHIFHFHCLSQWRARATSCPQCRTYDPVSHRIYLNFESTQDYETLVKDLKEKLKISDNQVNELSAKLKNCDNKFKKIKEEICKKEQKRDDIQRLYNVSEQWRAELVDKIQLLCHENNKLKESQTFEKDINREIKPKTLNAESINKTEDELQHSISLLTTENRKLKENINENETSKMILNYKLEMLEQRIKHLTSELKKQIAESINTSADNITQPINSKALTNKGDNLENSSNKKTPTEKRRRPRKRTSNTKTQISKTNILSSDKFELAQPNDSKIVIKDFPRDNIKHPLQYNVILLASIMSISVTPEDILNVCIIDPKSKSLSNKIAILVEFKTLDIKKQFISKRNQLKLNSFTKFILIKEYINDTVFPLFMYANRNLRANGYQYICCKNNEVFAKKNILDSDQIAIKSKSDVDKLLARPVKSESLEINRTENINLDSDNICYEFFDWFDG